MKKLTMLFTLLMLAMIVLALTAISAQDVFRAEQLTKDGVAVSLYNQGSALIRERRTFDLRSGLNRINFSDVAASIDPTSVGLTSLTDPDGTYVVEQNYVYDLVNSGALLERYLDEQVEIVTRDGDQYAGQLLSGRRNLIIRLESGEVVEVATAQITQIRFPALPEALVTRPTLRWLIYSSQDGPQQLELTYLTSGLSWTADYNLLLARDDAALNINGWVTLNNTSGATYDDTLLKLVAGDVNRIRSQTITNQMATSTPTPAPTATLESMQAPDVAQREFFEYQLYEVARGVTIGDNESKQIEFVSEVDVPATTFYVYDGSPPHYGYGGVIDSRDYGLTGRSSVQTMLSFTTDEDEGVGADLPAGRVRVYQQDVDGATLFIRQSSIDHTPEGEDVELFLGTAVDLTGQRILTNYVRLGNTALRETYEIRLRNFKDDETVQIRVPERLNRWSNWQISSDTDYEKLNAFTIEFRVDVPPRGETVTTYTVQYDWSR